MSNPSLVPFDPSPIIKNRPWFERALEAVAPNYALKRLEAQVQRELFSYNASITSRIYAPRTYGQPSESTQTTRSRVVMMWEARDLVENVPQARAVSRKFGQYLTPHEYSPTTGDKKYNEIVDSYFHEWCKTCDISGRHSFKKLIQLAAEERPVDGDCGFAIRRVGDDLKIQLIPATRIGDPNAIGAESDHYFQGVIVDDFGKPVAYRIYRVTREGVYFGAEEIAAENFTHYFDPFRIDQMRGITDFHCSSRTIRMLNEILEAEKSGVRFASQQAALVFSDRGTANPRNLFQPGPPNVTLPNGQEQQNEFSQVATIRYFGNADRIELMPSRPSNAFAGFIAHLMHEIAIGTGIPQGVLFGTEDYSGPSVRAEFAAADRVFARHQGVLKDKVLDPIKNAVLLDAIARSEIPPPPVQEGETLIQALKRATKGEWRFPAKLTIDVGRESAANMAENRQGAKSLQEIAASEGTDAFARLDQIAAEAAYVKELSTKYDVPETAIRLTTQNLPATPVQAASAGNNVGETAVEIQQTTDGSTAIESSGSDVAEEGSAELATTEGGAPSSDKAEPITVNFADGSFIPTKEMAANAARALEVRARKSPSQRGMTAVGIARARDISNRKSLSEETVRRMKAYFDRHEIDKKGSTWNEQGKGWQAWQGWGGDAGRAWANGIVERLNKTQLAQPVTATKPILFASAKDEIQLAIKGETVNPNAWLDAVSEYRKQLTIRVADLTARATEAAKPIVTEPLVNLAEKIEPKNFIMPTPEKGEKGDAFLSRCMANPTMVKDYPDNAQRYAVCQTQLKARE
jgi:capsid protein